LREFGPPEMAQIQAMPYMQRQSLHDAKIKSGGRHAATSRHLKDLDDGAIDALVSAMERTSSPVSAVRIITLGGAAGRVVSEATAYPHRSARYAVWASVSWGAGEPVERHLAWQRSLLAGIEPYASGAYVNMMSDEGELGVRMAYGADAYRRLQIVKRTYDPENIFRSNQNIAP
jgi:hypothetical protein